MTGKTHRVGGILSCFVGYTVLKDNGLLVDNINPLLQVTIMYPFALFGSTLQDLDHNEDSIPSKDIVSVLLNRTLHLSTKARKIKEKATGKGDMGVLSVFDAKHRSWQTHSDLFLLLCISLFYYLVTSPVQTAETAILRMLIAGVTLGVLSHCVLDLLTPEGIWSILFVFINKVGKNVLPKGFKLPEKIHLVPKSKFFATDGYWEDFVKGILWVLNIVYLLIIIYPLLPYRIEFNIG